jgi:hypothetical protein
MGWVDVGWKLQKSGERLRNLGWKPTGPSIYESLPSMMDEEIKLANGQ